MKNKIKLLSWNIWYECNFEQVTKFLSEADADIITLQEIVLDDPLRDVNTFLKNLGYQNVVTPLVEFTDDNNKLVKLHVGIFSKYQIIESFVRPLR